MHKKFAHCFKPLIFLEDASDLRHTLYLEYSASLLGEDVAGIPTRIVSDTIFSAFILAVPLYALLGHARTVWPSRSARRFMLAGFGLYALAVGLAALRHLDRFYASLGEAIDSWLLISRWPASPQVPDDMQYFYVVDALLKETVEALGAACLLAMVLAYAAWHRRTEEHRAFPDD